MPSERKRRRTEKGDNVRHRPEYDRERIGKNLKRLREAKNLSVEEVKEYLRLGSVQAIYKYENGQSYPQADTMFALMELYEADLDDIIREPQEAKVRTVSRDEIEVIAVENDGGRWLGRLLQYFQFGVKTEEAV